MLNQQLELELGRERQAAALRRRRASRANWWFARMREVVDAATDWRPTAPARPQQTWLDELPRRLSA